MHGPSPTSNFGGPFPSPLGLYRPTAYETVGRVGVQIPAMAYETQVNISIQPAPLPNRAVNWVQWRHTVGDNHRLTAG